MSAHRENGAPRLRPARSRVARAALWGALLASCSTVKMHRVRDDYPTVDRHATKRLAIVTSPLPDGSAPAGELFSLVTRRYVNQKRNFLVKEHVAQNEALELSAVCVEGIEGVLWLKPNVRRVGEGVEAALEARLLRCRDGQEVWAADAAGSFSSRDAKLTEVTQQYASELGAEVTPYVAPAFNLLRPTLDTLPDPALTEDDINEKIELGE